MPGWIGWTAGYALVIWGIDTAYSLAELWLSQANRRVQDAAAGIRFLIPLPLAFLIGFRLRSWWWVLSPCVAIVVTMITFAIGTYLERPQAERRQVTTGLVIGIGATAFDAIAAAFVAFAGVVVGWWLPAG